MTPASSSTPATHPSPSFLEDLRRVLSDLRSAILELMADVGADPVRPQDVARDFGLNKNLTWKISKIAGTDELLSVVAHVPGRSGLEIFCKAMTRAGADVDRVARVATAAARYEDAVNLHTDDRSTLEIMVDGALTIPQQTEQMRKLAYQGGSAIWGVRAKAHMSFMVLMPNADHPDEADLVQIGGLIGFRRLHMDRRWLLLRRERWSDDATANENESSVPLAPGMAPGGVPLLPQFCSSPLPEVTTCSTDDEIQVELPPGPVGNTAALTCVYGEVARRAGPAYADSPGEVSELGTTVITPAEHLVLDLMVHRDFEWAMHPELVVYGRLDGGGLHHAERRDRNLLRVPEEPMDLGMGLAGLATPVIPQQRAMADYVFTQIDRNPNEFRAFRVAMAYPPMPVVALLRSPLPLRG